MDIHLYLSGEIALRLTVLILTVITAKRMRK
jgi:hypothetical protein